MNKIFLRAIAIFCLLLLLFFVLYKCTEDKHVVKKQKATVNNALDFPERGSITNPYSNLESGDWSFKGPYDWGSRVIRLAVDPNDSYRLYAGSASGGLWLNEDTRSDKGWQWVNTGDFKVLGVKGIAIHPDNSNIIYIGTGEVYNAEESYGGYDLHKTRGTYGIGILYSIDKGENWIQARGLDSLNKLGIQDLIIVPREEDEYSVWAATTHGVYYAEDGKNFELSKKVKMVTSINVNPDNNKEIVAAAGNLNTPDAGIYFSNDNGNNWEQVMNRTPSIYMGKTELGRSFSNPNKIYAYSGTWNPLYFENNIEGSIGECEWQTQKVKESRNWLYSSVNGGKDWVLEHDTYNNPDSSSYSGGQGHYSICVTVNPQDEDVLYLGGISPLSLSENAGDTIKNYTSASGLNDKALINAMGSFDVHQMVFAKNNPEIVYVCSDQGVYMSDNGLQDMKRINRNLAIMQFYPRMGFDDTDTGVLFGCAQDYGPGSLSYQGYIDSIGRERWKLEYGFGHEAGCGLYDKKNGIAYTSIHMGSMISRRYYLDTAMIDMPDTSSSTGENGALHYMLDLNPFGNSSMCYLNAAWNAPLSLSPENPDVLYTAKDVVYTSLKTKEDKAAGKVWEIPNKEGQVEALDGNPILQMIVNPKNHLELYIATTPRFVNAKMRLYHSVDGANTWDEITGDNMPKKRNPSFLIQDPNDSTILYLTVDGTESGRVWKGINNEGSWTWKQIDSGLPKAYTRSIAADPSFPGHLFVATDYGVYKSENYGEDWSLFSSGLPSAIEGVQLIVYDEERVLRLISHGNGMWERSIK